MKDLTTAALTDADLAERNIYVDDVSRVLLPYTLLDREEIDILLSYFGLREGRTLSVRIGGIGFRAYCSDADDKFVEVLVNVAADCFTYPFTVQVKVSHEPQTPDEHSEMCAYHLDGEDWPKDENGEAYSVRDPQDMKYNEEEDRWYAEVEDRDYDAECNCEYVEESDQTFTVEDEEGLAAAKASIDALF